MIDFEKKSINEKFIKNRLKLNKKTQTENFQKFLYNRLKPNSKSTILDLGCGYGQTSLSILSKSKYNTLYSVDINKFFINKLKPLKKKYKKFYPLVKGMDSIKFRDEKFDLIIMSYCIYYSKNYKHLLEKLIRTLRKGGRIIIANPYRPHFMVNFVSKIHSLDKKIYESLDCSDFIYSFVLQKRNVTANKIFFSNETVLTKRDILNSYINSTMYNLHKVDLVKYKINRLKKRKFKFIKKTCLIEIKKNKIIFMKIIPYGKHYIDKKDLNSVIKTLQKDKITTGKTTINFENKISEYLKCKYVSTCNSGTSALYLAMQSINIKKNDTIIMPSINFISSYTVAKLFDAKVFLADVDRFTGQMRPDDVINCIKKFKLKSIKALVVMYNGGYPQNAEKFIKLKKKYKFFIIEDACHALGATYKINNKTFKIGSCAHSDISAFSLHPLKTITTGEGGLVTTNVKFIDTNIKKLRSLGQARDNKRHWKYDVIFKGLNLRMTDFQAALGISQLRKINKFLNYRKKVKDIYNKNLNKNNKIHIPDHKKNYISSNHLYIINFVKPNLKKKESFLKTMLQKNIILQYHYIPIYKFKIFNDKFISQNAEIYYKSSVSLPIYYGLKLEDQKKVIRHINKFI